jgi:peptidoglycan/xylan/chitin deacetylase (PgdA/CDA1 family)
VIAITIDDGFSTSAVLADLAILESEHVNATWFPIGHVVASAPDTWREVAGAGFPIGNHTYDHTNLTRHSYAQVLADIEKDNAVVGKVIGERLVPFVRPMGGSWNTTVLAAAAAAKERAVVLWDATTGDTGRLPGRADVDLLVRNATRGTDGSIILMHANLPYTQQALPRIIAYYRERGFEFVTLGQMFGVPGPVPFPPDVPTQPTRLLGRTIAFGRRRVDSDALIVGRTCDDCLSLCLATFSEATVNVKLLGLLAIARPARPR